MHATKRPEEEAGEVEVVTRSSGPARAEIVRVRVLYGAARALELRAGVV